MSTSKIATAPAEGKAEGVTTAEIIPLKPEPSMLQLALDAAGQGVPVSPLHYTFQLDDGSWACSCSKGAACPRKSWGKHPATDHGRQPNRRQARGNACHPLQAGPGGGGPVRREQ